MIKVLIHMLRALIWNSRLSIGTMLTPQVQPTLPFGTSNCSSIFSLEDLESLVNKSVPASVPDFGPKNDFSDLYRLSYNLYPIIG